MEPWDPQHGSLLERPATGGRWIFPGRRLLMAGSWTAGIEEVWAHPWRIAHGFRLAVDGAAPATHLALRSPVLVDRALGGPDGTARERCVVSAVHSICIWDLAAAGSAVVQLEWESDLAAPGEVPVRLRCERTAHGVLLEHPDGRRCEVRLLAGEAITARDRDGRAALRARGLGAVRLAFLAGFDAADLGRAADRLARRGAAGISEERTQHARLIADYGTALETPDAADAERFEWAKHATDALLVERARGVRRLAARYREPGGADWRTAGPVVPASPASLRRLGEALLAAGIREPVRDASRHPEDEAAMRALAEPLHAWAGDVPPPAVHPPAEAGAAGESRADDAPPAPWQLLGDELLGRWGLRAESGRSLALTPLVGERRSMALRRVRVGGSVVDLELSRRFDRITARLHRRHGGTLPVALALRDAEPIAVSADDQPLPPGRVVVPVADRHDVVLQL